VLTAVIFIGGLAFAIRHGHPATPFHASELFKPDFATSGFLFGTVLLYLVGVETPFNMGAEFLSVRKSATRMILWGSIGLVAIYLLTTIGTMLVLPTAKINSVTGVIDNLGTSLPPGVMETGAVVLAVIVFVALATYSIAYSRLIFVSGLERHLPRIFTHLNPRTRNPVTAILIQGAISSVLVIALFSQSSLVNVTIYLTGALSVIWLFSSLFFFIPPLIARVRYADRYENEDFWRIPGGKPGVWVTCVVGIIATLGGIYYSFAAPWIDVPKGTWMTWLGSIIGATVAVMGLVYVFGRRAASKLNQEDSLAHLAQFDLSDETSDPAR
jgi:amino acid transporter